MSSHKIAYKTTTADGRTLQLSGEYIVAPRSRAICFTALFAEDLNTGKLLEAYAEEHREAIEEILEQTVLNLLSQTMSKEIPHEL